jgi:uncharacterized protein YdeI (YjbR/CyaY-like superfamily)
MADGPRFFATPEDFRTWLEKQHLAAAELLVGFWKVGSGAPSITWPQSVDEALCHGWIDGVRKRIDEASYTIRFTPRKPGSNWSAINVARVAELTALGRMRPAGLAAFERRALARTGIYAYEQRHAAVLDLAFERRFKADRKAWGWFQAQAPSYRQVAIWHIVCAKREATKESRLAALIAASARGERLF